MCCGRKSARERASGRKARRQRRNAGCLERACSHNHGTGRKASAILSGRLEGFVILPKAGDPSSVHHPVAVRVSSQVVGKLILGRIAVGTARKRLSREAAHAARRKQREAVVPVPPAIADSRKGIHHEIVHARPLESMCGGETRLPSAYERTSVPIPSRLLSVTWQLRYGWEGAATDAGRGVASRSMCQMP